MLNQEEKDLLYEEFKQRLTKEEKSKKSGKGQTKVKQMTFLSKARDHFNERRDYFIYNLRNEETNSCLYAYGWDNIRHLICWSYGVCCVERLPDDKQEEINTFTIKMIDNLFDQFDKTGNNI